MHIALITGASRGLGREIALTLTKNDCQVIAAYHRADKGFIEYFGDHKKNIFPFKVDLSKKTEVEEMIQAVEDRFERLDYVINSAGVIKDCLLVKHTETDWNETVSVNLTACFYIIKNTVPLLMNSMGGHIINISSISGVKGNEGQAAYSASKAALIGLTFTAAKELAPFNIRVNAVLPGYMKTEMGMKNQLALKRAQNKSVLNCLSSPLEVASFLYSLLKTEKVTGQVFPLDSRII